jgi:hypothetical protein
MEAIRMRLNPMPWRFLLRRLLGLALASFATGFLHADIAPASAPVQVDVSKLFNTRVVTTLTNGKVVPLQAGVDAGAGLITKAAAVALGSSPEHTLPDDGRFPATADHPEVVLHFSNADGTGNQVRRSLPADDYSFAVPPRNYAKMFLFFTSAAEGPAPLKIILTYQAGSTENRDLVCPDYWKDLDPGDKDDVYLAHDLSKWGPDNKRLEKDHHNIFGFDVHPTPGKVLTKIEVQKTRPIVVFWGATGQPANGG